MRKHAEACAPSRYILRERVPTGSAGFSRQKIHRVGGEAILRPVGCPYEDREFGQSIGVAPYRFTPMLLELPLVGVLPGAALPG